MIYKDWDEFDLFTNSTSNLVVNGEFPNSVGNWVVEESKGNIFWENGRLILESLSYWARAYQVIKVNAGEKYKFSGDLDSGTNGGYIQLRSTTDNDSGSILKEFHSSTDAFEFTSPTDTLVIRLHAGYHKSGRCSFDNIKLTPS